MDDAEINYDELKEFTRNLFDDSLVSQEKGSIDF